MRREELTTFAAALVVLGILFGEDLLVGYSFIGAGVTLAIIVMIKSKGHLEKDEPSHE